MALRPDRSPEGTQTSSIRVLLGLVLAISVLPVRAAELSRLHRQIDAVVAEAKAGDPAATEHREARTVHLADVDGDQVKDALVFFTIEGMAGGNNYAMYMALFKGEQMGYRFVDKIEIGGGGRGAVSFNPPIIRQGKIIIRRIEYSAGDARCCPRRESVVAVTLRGSRLSADPVPKWDPRNPRWQR